MNYNKMINKLAENVFQLYFKEFGSCVYLIKIGKNCNRLRVNYFIPFRLSNASMVGS